MIKTTLPRERGSVFPMKVTANESSHRRHGAPESLSDEALSRTLEDLAATQPRDRPHNPPPMASMMPSDVIFAVSLAVSSSFVFLNSDCSTVIYPRQPLPSATAPISSHPPCLPLLRTFPDVTLGLVWSTSHSKQRRNRNPDLRQVSWESRGEESPTGLPPSRCAAKDSSPAQASQKDHTSNLSSQVCFPIM